MAVYSILVAGPFTQTIATSSAWALQVVTHFHLGKRCTAASHDPSCAGTGVWQSCDPSSVTRVVIKGPK
jgi:hypothetical protein